MRQTAIGEQTDEIGQEIAAAIADPERVAGRGGKTDRKSVGLVKFAPVPRFDRVRDRRSERQSEPIKQVGFAGVEEIAADGKASADQRAAVKIGIEQVEERSVEPDGVADQFDDAAAPVGVVLVLWWPWNLPSSPVVST